MQVLTKAWTLNPSAQPLKLIHTGLIGTGKRRDVLHLLIQGLIMDWPVLNNDLVVARLGLVKVCNCVLHPVLVITLCEVLTCMRASALLWNDRESWYQD